MHEIFDFRLENEQDRKLEKNGKTSIELNSDKTFTHYVHDNLCLFGILHHMDPECTLPASISFLSHAMSNLARTLEEKEVVEPKSYQNRRGLYWVHPCSVFQIGAMKICESFVSDFANQTSRAVVTMRSCLR